LKTFQPIRRPKVSVKSVANPKEKVFENQTVVNGNTSESVATGDLKRLNCNAELYDIGYSKDQSY